MIGVGQGKRVGALIKGALVDPDDTRQVDVAGHAGGGGAQHPGQVVLGGVGVLVGILPKGWLAVQNRTAALFLKLIARTIAFDVAVISGVWIARAVLGKVVGGIVVREGTGERGALGLEGHKTQVSLVQRTIRDIKGAVRHSDAVPGGKEDALQTGAAPKRIVVHRGDACGEDGQRHVLAALKGILVNGGQHRAVGQNAVQGVFVEFGQTGGRVEQGGIHAVPLGQEQEAPPVLHIGAEVGGGKGLGLPPGCGIGIGGLGAHQYLRRAEQVKDLPLQHRGSIPQKQGLPEPADQTALLQGGQAPGQDQGGQVPCVGQGSGGDGRDALGQDTGAGDRGADGVEDRSVLGGDEAVVFRKTHRSGILGAGLTQGIQVAAAVGSGLTEQGKVGHGSGLGEINVHRAGGERPEIRVVPVRVEPIPKGDLFSIDSGRGVGQKDEGWDRVGQGHHHLAYLNGDCDGLVKAGRDAQQPGHVLVIHQPVLGGGILLVARVGLIAVVNGEKAVVIQAGETHVQQRVGDGDGVHAAHGA